MAIGCSGNPLNTLGRAFVNSGPVSRYSFVDLLTAEGVMGGTSSTVVR